MRGAPVVAPPVRRVVARFNMAAEVTDGEDEDEESGEECGEDSGLRGGVWGGEAEEEFITASPPGVKSFGVTSVPVLRPPIPPPPAPTPTPAATTASRDSSDSMQKDLRSLVDDMMVGRFLGPDNHKFGLFICYSVYLILFCLFSPTLPGSKVYLFIVVQGCTNSQLSRSLLHVRNHLKRRRGDGRSCLSFVNSLPRLIKRLHS